MSAKYKLLEAWQKLFFDLNKKLGNDVWGARLEGGTDEQWDLLRIFVSERKFVDIVLEETGGELAGLPIKFTIYSQEAHTLLERKKNKK